MSKNPFINALQDIQQAGRQYPAWLHLGLLEVKQRYRRSVLGPWWITISTLIFIAAMGAIFSRLLTQPLDEYIPFFTAGYLLWTFISTCLNESTDLFRSNSSCIKQLKLPYHLYVMKFLVRQAIAFSHNFVVYLLAAAYFRFNPGWSVLLAIPALFLLIVNLYWMSLFTALASTRFRDMVPIVNSGLQILFFLTPISWMPRMIGPDTIIVKLNPFYYLIEIVRQPLLGSIPALSLWLVAAAFAAGGFAVSFFAFSLNKSQIPFWID